MDVIDKLRRRLESLMPTDSSVVHPVKILAGLKTTAEKHRKIFIKTTLVPDVYTVYLSKKDLSDLRPFLRVLTDELITELSRFIQHKGYKCAATRVAIKFAESDRLDPGHIDIEPAFKASQDEGSVDCGTDSIENKHHPPSVAATEFRIQISSNKKPSEILVLTPGNHIIGRGHNSDLTVPDPLVSLQHCRMQVGKDEMMIEDLGSTNGTLVNNRRIMNPATLSPGDIVTLGNTTIEVLN